MAVLTQEQRIAAEQQIREQLGLPMMSANPSNSVSAETLQIEREILGAQAYAFGEVWSRPGLSIQDRCYITIAVLTAKDQFEPLEDYIKASLRVGISASDILEALLHLGSYTGLTSASAAMNVARRVFTDQGITQPSSEALTPAYPMTRDGRVEAMTRVSREVGIAQHGVGVNNPPLQHLQNGAWKIPGKEFPSEADFARINGEYGYGECWGRSALGYRIRSLLTVASLQALFANEQLHFHLNNAVNNGMDANEIHEVLGQAGVYCGGACWKNAANIARDIFSQRGMLID